MPEDYKYKRLRVYLDNETSDIYIGKFNSSYALWEYIKMEIPDPNDRKLLGLYAPDNHTNDPQNAKYIQTYTIGDLINFLHYNYHYNTLYDPHECNTMLTHRRLSIIPVPADRVSIDDRHRMNESQVKNMRCDYVWVISMGSEVLGQDVELVEALYKAVKCVYLEKKLYKIPLKDAHEGSIVKVDEGRYTQYDIYEIAHTEKRFLHITDNDLWNNLFTNVLSENDINKLDIYPPNYRTVKFLNSTSGKYFQVYDLGDLISFLFYNYYSPANIKDKSILLHKRLTIIPVPNYSINNPLRFNNLVDDTLNDRINYRWLIQIDGEILGQENTLVDSLTDAVTKVYSTPLHNIILNEIDTVYTTEQQTEFSLTDV